MPSSTLSAAIPHKLSIRGISSREGQLDHRSESRYVSLLVNVPNTGLIKLEKVDTCRITVTEVKKIIADKANIPREHLILKIAGKPTLILRDHHRLHQYNHWHQSILDMVVEVTEAFHYISVCEITGCTRYYVEADHPDCNHKHKLSSGYTLRREIYKTRTSILQAYHCDTITILKSDIITELRLDDPKDKLFYEPVRNEHLPCWIPDKATIFQKWHDSVYKGKDIQHQELPNLSVRLLYIENNSDGVKNVYLIQLFDNLGAHSSHHNPNDYLFLCVEYNIEVNKLYTMVADYYKISVTHVVLMLSTNSLLPADNVPLHSVFFHPIILYKDKGLVHDGESRYRWVKMGSTRGLVAGEHSHCFIAHCELASKAMDDPIIKHVVAERPDAWEVIFKVFNFNNPTRISIEENSEDDRIRCMDVMHRIYHHDDHITWEFVEIQVRREDPQLADVIRTQL